MFVTLKAGFAVLVPCAARPGACVKATCCAGALTRGLDPRPVRDGRLDRLTIQAFENGLCRQATQTN